MLSSVKAEVTRIGAISNRLVREGISDKVTLWMES